MQPVESKRILEKIGGTFAGTANAAELHDLFRTQVQLITGGYDHIRDTVMAASFAESA
jgi:hypothetical protein